MKVIYIGRKEGENAYASSVERVQCVNLFQLCLCIEQFVHDIRFFGKLNEAEKINMGKR
jgi:hypothetical protein